MLSIEDWKLIAAVIGGLGGAYVFITRPIMSEMKAQMSALELHLSDVLWAMRK
jgi:hypothetical protein